MLFSSLANWISFFGRLKNYADQTPTKISWVVFHQESRLKETVTKKNPTYTTNSSLATEAIEHNKITASNNPKTEPFRLLIQSDASSITVYVLFPGCITNKGEMGKRGNLMLPCCRHGKHHRLQHIETY